MLAFIVLFIWATEEAHQNRVVPSHATELQWFEPLADTSHHAKERETERVLGRAPRRATMTPSLVFDAWMTTPT